jgi:hypothetical protein
VRSASIEIPQKSRIVESLSDNDPTAVIVAEISDPTDANAGMELIDLDAAPQQSVPSSRTTSDGSCRRRRGLSDLLAGCRQPRGHD